MKKRTIMMILTLAVSVVLAGCAAEDKEGTGTQQENETADSTAADTMAADSLAEDGVFGAFEATTLNCETVTQSIFADADLTMVNIWATYCTPCISEMPAIGELAAEYADKGLQIVGIISDVTSAPNMDAGYIVEYTGADYTHLVCSPSLRSGYLSQIQVVPTTVFVDSEGDQVGEVYTGAKSKEAWMEIIDDLLKE